MALDKPAKPVVDNPDYLGFPTTSDFPSILGRPVAPNKRRPASPESDLRPERALLIMFGARPHFWTDADENPGNGFVPADIKASYRVEEIFGVSVAVLKRQSALSLILERLQRGWPTCVAFANANLLMHARHDRDLRNSLNKMLILNDGVGVDIASWWIHGSPFPENLNGSDFTPELLARLPLGTRVFLYGAQRSVVERAAKVLEARFPIVVAGWGDGFTQGGASVACDINEAKAEVVLVALGNPFQEKWIAEFAPIVTAPVLMAVGAYFDFAASQVPRAPRWIRNIRLEWVYRLSREPRRLWKRYTLGVMGFLGAVFIERWLTAINKHTQS